MKLFLIAAVIALSACHRAPVARPEPSASVQAFLREGALLRTYCAQGVDFKTYSDQLARTESSFDLAFAGDTGLRKSAFQQSVTYWSGALIPWKQKLRGRNTFLDAGYDLDRLSLYFLTIGEPKPKDRLMLYHELNEYVRLCMTKGSEAFSKGYEENFSTGK